MDKKKTYVPMPAIDPAMTERYETVMQAINGTITVSEGARRLNLSRNHFQSLMHRALGSFVEELIPKVGGRPAMPERERQLQEETQRLRQENEHLRRQVETTDRILNVASDLLRGRLKTPRERGTHAPNDPTEDE